MLLEIPENTAGKQLRDFATHFADSALLSPLKAGYQLAQKSTGGILPEIEIKKSESSKTTGAFLGDLAGTGAVFAGSWLLTRSAFNKVGLNPNLQSTLLGKSAVSGIEMATTGALVGTLHTVDSRKDFWSTKGEQTAYFAISSGLYGAGWKALSSSGVFGKEGERTLKQAILMNSTAGGGAGISDSFLRHGIIDKRLPTTTELAQSATQFALIGAGFGVAEIVAPRMLGFTGKAEQPNKTLDKEIRLNLSMDTRPDLRSSPAPSIEVPPSGTARQITNPFGEFPLPRFDKIPTPKVNPEQVVSPAALEQSIQYSSKGIIESKFVDGLRLTTVNNSKGFSSTGGPADRFERFIAIDKSTDSALAAVIEDARARFGKMELNGETSMHLRNYVSSIMNRYGLPPATLEEVYIDTLRRNTQGVIPLGAFICKGSGVCLPRAALLKSIGDELGMNVRLREGFIGINKPQSHVWTEIDFGKGFKVYDPMHPPNPLYKYTSTKH